MELSSRDRLLWDILSDEFQTIVYTQDPVQAARLQEWLSSRYKVATVPDSEAQVVITTNPLCADRPGTVFYDLSIYYW